MDPSILGGLGPGFLHQVPTLTVSWFSTARTMPWSAVYVAPATTPRRAWLPYSDTLMPRGTTARWQADTAKATIRVKSVGLRVWGAWRIMGPSK